MALIVTEFETVPQMRLSATGLARYADLPGVTDGRRSFLLGLVEEIAQLNRANENPYYSWEALVTERPSKLKPGEDNVEIVRSRVVSPYLD